MSAIVDVSSYEQEQETIWLNVNKNNKLKDNFMFSLHYFFEKSIVVVTPWRKIKGPREKLIWAPFQFKY